MITSRHCPLNKGGGLPSLMISDISKTPSTPSTPSTNDPRPSTHDPRPSNLDFNFCDSLFIKFGKQYQVNIYMFAHRLQRWSNIGWTPRVCFRERHARYAIYGHLIRRIARLPYESHHCLTLAQNCSSPMMAMHSRHEATVILTLKCVCPAVGLRMDGHPVNKRH